MIDHQNIHSIYVIHRTIPIYEMHNMHVLHMFMIVLHVHKPLGGNRPRVFAGFHHNRVDDTYRNRSRLGLRLQVGLRWEADAVVQIEQDRERSGLSIWVLRRAIEVAPATIQGFDANHEHFSRTRVNYGVLSLSKVKAKWTPGLRTPTTDRSSSERRLW